MTPTLTPKPPSSEDETACCRRCGTPAESGSIFCKNCSGALSPPAPLIDLHEQPADAVPQVRPWVRYWARMFDFSLYSVVAGILLEEFFPTAVTGKTNEFGFTFLLLFTWIFVESNLLAVIGTTPGKALFRIHLRLQGSDSIPFLNAFYRSLRVWWRGWGAGFPFISLFTLLHAESVLSRDGITSWDREGGFIVRHEKIGVVRTTVAVVFLGLVYILSIYVKMTEMGQG
jgi:RDD family protein